MTPWLEDGDGVRVSVVGWILAVLMKHLSRTNTYLLGSQLQILFSLFNFLSYKIKMETWRNVSKSNSMCTVWYREDLSLSHKSRLFGAIPGHHVDGRMDTPLQWWANTNPDLDLNLDLTNFPNLAGFGFDSKIFKSVDLDLDLDHL